MPRRPAALLSRAFVPGALGVAFLWGSARATVPLGPPTPEPNGQIQLVQQPPPVPPVQPSQPVLPEQPPSTTPATSPAAATTALASSLAVPSQFGTPGGSSSASASPNLQAVGQQAPISFVSGAEVQPRAATDIGNLLIKSPSATGVEVQQRTPVITDPRVRGYHVGQLQTWLDDAYFFPARQDLDTAVSKIDPHIIRDLVILKGPYTVRYGPGFSFLIVETQETPRYEAGTEWHGRTTLTYQTNGDRWDGRQSVWGGGQDWGYRLAYGIRAGSDYSAGDGSKVPSSYNAQDVDYAVGFNLTPDTKIEFRGLRLHQHDLEFAGNQADLNRLDTDAYSLRFLAEKQEYFDHLALDLWYNRTAGDGNNLSGPKQTFLLRSFGGTEITTNDFSELSRGLRLGTTWGDLKGAHLTVGLDVNNVEQRLEETERDFIPRPTRPEFVLGTTSILGIPQAMLVDAGLFVEGALPLGDRLTLKAGLRADWVRTDSADRMIIGNQPGTTVNSEQLIRLLSVSPNDFNLTRHFDLFSGYLTGEYKLNPHLTALGGFGYAERPPTLTELYAAGPFVSILQPGKTRVIGDPHLQNEALRQLDVGLKADYGRFRAGVNGFYAWVDNYITFDAPLERDPVLRALFRTPQAIFTNTDLATLAGGELYGEVDVTDWLTPFVTMSYIEGRDQTHVDNRHPLFNNNPELVGSSRAPGTAPQEALPGIPPLETRLGLRLHEARRDPRWALEFTARVVDDQSRVATSLLEVATPGFTIYDLRGYWRAYPNLLLTSGVENIGNKFYREHLDSVYANALFRPGTNFYFGVELEY
jgi:iron complex outermembrane recepter protein